MHTTHTVRVTFHRDDRDDPVIAGDRVISGEDYELFDERAARERLIADGDLVIGAEVVTFGGTIVPSSRLDRISIEIIAKGRAPAADEPA